MKGFKLLLLIFFVSQNLARAQTVQSKFDFLRKYDGQYAYNVKLLENKKLKQALIAVIGLSRYEFIRKNCGVENPIEVKGGIFTASGCQQHNCSDTNYIIVINIPDGSVYAGIRENGKATIYPEGATGIVQLTNWLSN